MGRQRKYSSNAARQKAYRQRAKRNARALRNSDEWYTPDAVLDAARDVLGEIDLDPASCDVAQRRVRAFCHFTKETDGLSQPWLGRVWLNPPYSFPLVQHFTSKLLAQYAAGHVTAAICVVNNASDTEWFQVLLRNCPACFTGRIRFWRGDGRRADNPRVGQVFFYLGADPMRFHRRFSELGTVCFPGEWLSEAHAVYARGFTR